MPFSWVGRSASVARTQGYDVREALALAGVHEPDGDLIKTDAELGPAEFMLMCLMLINAVDDELHAVTRSRMMRGTASLASMAMLSARDLQQAVLTIARIFAMTDSSCQVTLNRSESIAEIEIHANGDDGAMSAFMAEMMAVHLHQQLSFYLGFLLPLERFVTSAPDHPALGFEHPYLLCPVRNGQVTSLSFSVKHLGTPCKARLVDGALADSHAFWLARHPFSVGAQAPALVESTHPIKHAVYQKLLTNDFSFPECCIELSITASDLRHGLLSEGTRYRAVRRAALIERARPHLAAGARTEDLAAALGYSDSRSLRRALKLAAGLTIGDLRLDDAQPSAQPPGQISARVKEQSLRLA